MNFFEELITQGTQYQGIDLVAYSFSISVLLLPVALALALFFMFVQTCWEIRKQRRITKQRSKE